MMQAANLPEGNNVIAREGALHSHSTRSRTVLVEREMRSGVMMILKIARQHAAQVSLAQDDDVIQAFTADRTDETLDVGVLPWRSRGSDNLRDAHCANAITERRAIRFVPVPQQIARSSVPRQLRGHLAGKPALRGIWSDCEVNDPSTIEAEHDQGIKKLERRGDDYKHIN